MIKKILIANRGEIACRVMRTANKLGISTVAIYSDADASAQHVKLADESVYVGEALAAKSYLNGDLIIQKAKKLAVDAIHPGYGFLSENAEFADNCAQNGIIFIGPSPDAIRAMGSKSAAKTIMEKAQVPLVPGYHGDIQSPEFLLKEAKQIGYPVILKAAAGGGGKGMRQVSEQSQFMEALDAAKREAMKSFNDDIMLVEKYLSKPRHVEIQVFCDNHGNGVYLFERDCSVQRRHQKIIEEAPAPGISENTRRQMGEAALKAAFAIDYRGAGTVEFLLDDDGAFYFMEMNTRLQVEHPVTEFVTGEDLVEWQIIVANNLPLPKTQAQLTIKGHSFEARIYAEDPNNDFLPSTGTLSLLVEPTQSESVRVDSGVVTDDEVSIYYDPMIAKLIVWGENREQALAKLINSLHSYMICGLTSNIPYLIKVAKSQPFRDAQLSTDFVDRHSVLLGLDGEQSPSGAMAEKSLSADQQLAVLALLNSQSNSAIKTSTAYSSNKLSFSDFRLNHHAIYKCEFEVDKRQYLIDVTKISERKWKAYIDENEYIFEIERLKMLGQERGQERSQDHIQIKTNQGLVSYRTFKQEDYFYILHSDGLISGKKIVPDIGSQSEEIHAGNIVAPMNGTLIAMQVKPKQVVQANELLAIVEAMKMEHSLRAPFAGIIQDCHVQTGELVNAEQVLISLKPLNDE